MFYSFPLVKHLKLNDFKNIYKALKTNIPPIDLLILGFLVWIEEAYIEYKIKREVDDAIDEYHEQMDEQEADWKDQAVITEEYTHSSGLPTLSISNPVVDKNISTEYELPKDRLSRPCGGPGGFDDFVERWHE